MTIDEIDIKAEYGAFLMAGSYAALLAYPALKNVIANDWYEEEGIEVDLSQSVLESRTITLNFGVKGGQNTDEFMEFLAARQWKQTLSIPELGIDELELRVVGITSFDATKEGELATFSVTYQDPYLEEYMAEHEPAIENYEADEYELDGVNLGLYGAKVLEAQNGLRAKAALKGPLNRGISSVAGSIVDVAGAIKSESKDIQIVLKMTGGSLEEFWNNYYALLNALNKGDECTLACGSLMVDIPMFYQSGRCNDVIVGDDGSVWAIMTLGMKVTRPVTMPSDELLFAEDDEIMIITEDGYSVDMATV